MAGGASPRKPVEIISLTTLRGGLAVWVVLYHFWNDVLALFPAAEAMSPFVRVGHMAVPTFFMLSGFVLTYNYSSQFRHLHGEPIRSFLRGRLARIYPVHFVTLFEVAAMIWVSGRFGIGVTDTGYTMQNFVLNLFLMQTWVPYFTLNWNYPSWSISSEWFAYLLFPFITVAYTGLRLTAPGRATAVGIAALAGSIYFMLRWRPWPCYELGLVVPTFLAGVAVCWMHWGFRRTSGTTARWAGIALCAGVVACCFAFSGELAIALLLCLFFSLIVALAWAGDQCHRVWKVKPLVFLGEISYSLYMTHTLAQKLINARLPSSRFIEAPVLERVGVLTCDALLVVACCLASYFLVEKPCRKWFRQGTVPRVGTKPSRPAAYRLRWAFTPALFRLFRTGGGSS